jgi:hypothetical protein
MEKDVWLFLRGDRAIHVTRLPVGMTLLVRGPGSAEHSHHFDSEDSLNEFWRGYKRHLLGEEWVLHPTGDRRSGSRPAVRDRRRVSSSELLQAVK